jgi:NADH dehydrogenase FAD-containing subunit
VVGGGPAAAETAGNVWRCARQCIRAKGGKLPRIVLLAGRGLMRHYPDKVGELARESLRERGIEVNEDGYAERIEKKRVVLETGEIHEADAIFTALGTKPPKIIEESGLPVGPGGGLSVNEYLQCTERPELFGGGDCIHFSPEPLDRVGVHAVKENPVLHQNLLAALGEGELAKFEPRSKYMLIFNMGDGTGLLWRGEFACRNRPAFWLKNWIDKRFIRKFQP